MTTNESKIKDDLADDFIELERARRDDSANSIYHAAKEVAYHAHLLDLERRATEDGRVSVYAPMPEVQPITTKLAKFP